MEQKLRHSIELPSQHSIYLSVVDSSIDYPHPHQCQKSTVALLRLAPLSKYCFYLCCNIMWLFITIWLPRCLPEATLIMVLSIRLRITPTRSASICVLWRLHPWSSLIPILRAFQGFSRAVRLTKSASVKLIKSNENNHLDNDTYAESIGVSNSYEWQDRGQ